MGLLPDTQNCGLRMRRECRERFPHLRFQRKPLVSEPAMHNGTCVNHVPWCMSGSLTNGGGENGARTFPAFPAHAQPAILRIWSEAHEVEVPLHIHFCHLLGFWRYHCVVCPLGLRMNKVLGQMTRFQTPHTKQKQKQKQQPQTTTTTNTRQNQTHWNTQAHLNT